MDRAYEDNETRALALKRGFIPVVPPKKNRKLPWKYDAELYKRRNEVPIKFKLIKNNSIQILFSNKHSITMKISIHSL